MDKIQVIKLTDLHSFPDNPFKVVENEEFQALADSIKDYGVISPLVVRPRDEGGYEVIAGHRRMRACEKAGIEKVPAFVRSMDRDAAIIALVDSNLHRENILPSEKAFAYKMKLDAIKHQGKRTDLTSAQVVPKLSAREIVADEVGVNRMEVSRYIRLTELIPELLQMVDDSLIAISPAVELSYLSEKEQTALFETIESEDCTPSHAQAIRMKKLSQENKLDMNNIFSIMTEVKPNQQEKFKLSKERIRSYFPKSFTDKQIEDTLFKLLEQYKKKQLDRDSR